MKETWRWFGPNDPISISEIKQTGASGIVTALHHLAPGQSWSIHDVKTRKHQVEFIDGQPTDLSWDVVESVPVSEAIKTQSTDMEKHVEAYQESLRNLAACGIKTVCYNFMPVLDWTRTDLRAPLRNGGHAMRFDLIDFVVFDIYILERVGAADDYSGDICELAKSKFYKLSNDEKAVLSYNIVAGLPGANDNWSLDDVRDRLGAYNGMTQENLRSNLIDFLSEVIPTAENLGMRLCCHPDDPPFPLLGLPRVMSSQNDYELVLGAIDSVANGATFCCGSLGVAEDFDSFKFIKKLGPKIHFAHLRNTVRLGASDGFRHSFTEAEHLNGDTDMVAVVRALLDEENRRKDAGFQDCEIPMRPDHGHALLSDLTGHTQPGYPLVGRMRGLAELRGLKAGLE